MHFSALETVKKAFIRYTNSRPWDTTQKFSEFNAKIRLTVFELALLNQVNKQTSMIFSHLFAYTRGSKLSILPSLLD